MAIFDGPTQSGFDQLSQDLTNSVSNIGGEGVPPPPSLLGAIPGPRYRFEEEVVETANNEHISIGSAKRIVMAANSSENSTYVSAIRKLKNVENNTVRSLKSKGTGSRPPRSENSPSHKNASV